MFPWDTKTLAHKKSLSQICINSFDDRMLSHDRWLWFFFFGALTGPNFTRRCDLVVPADWAGVEAGRSNEDTTYYCYSFYFFLIHSAVYNGGRTESSSPYAGGIHEDVGTNANQGQLNVRTPFLCYLATRCMPHIFIAELELVLPTSQ